MEEPTYPIMRDTQGNLFRDPIVSIIEAVLVEETTGVLDTDKRKVAVEAGKRIRHWITHGAGHSIDPKLAKQ